MPLYSHQKQKIFFGLTIRTREPSLKPFLHKFYTIIIKKYTQLSTLFPYCSNCSSCNIIIRLWRHTIILVVFNSSVAEYIRVAKFSLVTQHTLVSLVFWRITKITQFVPMLALVTFVSLCTQLHTRACTRERYLCIHVSRQTTLRRLPHLRRILGLRNLLPC